MGKSLNIAGAGLKEGGGIFFCPLDKCDVRSKEV